MEPSPNQPLYHLLVPKTIWLPSSKFITDYKCYFFLNPLCPNVLLNYKCFSGYVLSYPIETVVSEVNFHLQLFVTTVEDICFHPEHFPERLFIDDTHHRALLTLGSVAKTMAKRGDVQRANQVISKIHDMLGIHGRHLSKCGKEITDITISMQLPFTFL